jgi:hypothetical protein
MEKSHAVEIALRQLANNQDISLTRQEKLMLAKVIFNNPTEPGTIPDVELFNMAVAQLLGNGKRMVELEKTPFKPVIALLPYMSQLANEYTDYQSKIENEMQESQAA